MRVRLYILWSLGFPEKARTLPPPKVDLYSSHKTFLGENNDERTSESHFLWARKCGGSNQSYIVTSFKRKICFYLGIEALSLGN